MKQVIQLDENGYFVGTTFADESPLENGVYLLPANSVEAEEPNVPDGYKALWVGSWLLEEISEPETETAPEPEIDPILLLRGVRNSRLESTDWWVLPDRTPTQAQLDYRQALRDITDTYSSLEDVVWPTQPE